MGKNLTKKKYSANLFAANLREKNVNTMFIMPTVEEYL